MSRLESVKYTSRSDEKTQSRGVTCDPRYPYPVIEEKPPEYRGSTGPYCTTHTTVSQNYLLISDVQNFLHLGRF